MSGPPRVVLRLPPLHPSGWSRGRRLVFLLGLALAVSLGVRTLLGERGLVGRVRMEAEASRLEAEVAALRRDLDAEREAVRDLRFGDRAIERIARESLGMALPGERIYLLPVAPPAAAAPRGDSLTPSGGE